MKKLLIILFSLGLAFGASAQKRGYHGGGHRVIIVPRASIGIGAYAPYYGYGFYSPWFYGYPYNYGYYSPRPTKLDMQIEDIKADYKDKKWSVKHDESLTKQERKQKIHDLKTDRDQQILDAKKNYYKPDDRQ
ncbi:MAG TPA: hypothetical protein VNS32_23300 [Flavisolibacter sp.]|nr:hypothetical protein [Flavisolibacter sp.]